MQLSYHSNPFHTTNKVRLHHSHLDLHNAESYIQHHRINPFLHYISATMPFINNRHRFLPTTFTSSTPILRGRISNTHNSFKLNSDNHYYSPIFTDAQSLPFFLCFLCKYSSCQCILENDNKIIETSYDE